MYQLDTLVAKCFNALHKWDVNSVNARRRELAPLPIGRKVWYRRPEGSGNKTDTRWLGPAEVLAREGDTSYKISH